MGTCVVEVTTMLCTGVLIRLPMTPKSDDGVKIYSKASLAFGYGTLIISLL